VQYQQPSDGLNKYYPTAPSLLAIPDGQYCDYGCAYGHGYGHDDLAGDNAVYCLVHSNEYRPLWGLQHIFYARGAA
jgi:hypothetical protein